ncbi:hypothetical protein A0H81_01790 [Grifola frondosa]|uniref:GTP-binding protein 2 n=1 Tax=Grifola frondosa TaxID=5627 RepID=A0A1C7MMC7_GRIFR|nr:hypothetical protein A0H81_01790 [Grifola frondosa]
MGSLPTFTPSEASSQLSKSLQNGVPKLAPEVEEGNVEYKLKLTHISPARFARLVTQLKWRLLEGGGQAYYEIGVADCGALIGLSRADLEESLETLEMMAGEIGASVIVVKEIEVPQAMVALADKESGYTDPETGDWTRKMKKRTGIMTDGDYSTTTTETETELSTADLTDFDDFVSSCSSLQTPADPTFIAPFPLYPTIYSCHPPHSNPTRPTAQSSPFISPIDDDLALFSMEPEPAHRDDADDELESELEPTSRPSFSGLEISSVYKPRPVRRRVHPIAATPSAALGAPQGRHNKRLLKNKEKKVQPWHHSPSKGVIPPAVTGLAAHKDERTHQRRLARDKRREEKRKALLAYAGAQGEEPPMGQDAGGTPASEIDLGSSVELRLTSVSFAAVEIEVEEGAAELVSELDALHVAVQASVDLVENVTSSPLAQDKVLPEPTVGTQEKEREPRLIVEALVVRKMSLEEAYLDFGGFSLV